MGLSNYYPSSRLSQAGVCTSSTRPASPYEGQMIYETDTNRVLVYDNTAWVMIADTDTPPGVQFITSNTFSAVSSVNVDSCFTSEFSNYLMTINITSVSGATGIFLRMRTGGITNSNSNYGWAGSQSYMGSTILAGINSGGLTTDWKLSDQDTGTYANTPISVEVMSPQLSYRTAIFSHGFTPVDPMPYYRTLGGIMSVTTSYDGFTLVTNSGSFTMSGTVRVYGYRNS